MEWSLTARPSSCGHPELDLPGGYPIEIVSSQSDFELSVPKTYINEYSIRDIISWIGVKIGPRRDVHGGFSDALLVDLVLEDH